MFRLLTLPCSCVGVMKDGRVEILVNDQGNRITPSYVAFTDDGRLVGDAAKNQCTFVHRRPTSHRQILSNLG